MDHDAKFLDHDDEFWKSHQELMRDIRKRPDYNEWDAFQEASADGVSAFGLAGNVKLRKQVSKLALAVTLSLATGKASSILVDDDFRALCRQANESW